MHYKRDCGLAQTRCILSGKGNVNCERTKLGGLRSVSRKKNEKVFHVWIRLLWSFFTFFCYFCSTYFVQLLPESRHACNETARYTKIHVIPTSLCTHNATLVAFDCVTFLKAAIYRASFNHQWKYNPMMKNGQITFALAREAKFLNSK